VTHWAAMTCPPWKRHVRTKSVAPVARAVTAVLVNVRTTVALHVVRAVLLVPMRLLLTAATSLLVSWVLMTSPPLSASAR